MFPSSEVDSSPEVGFSPEVGSSPGVGSFPEGERQKAGIGVAETLTQSAPMARKVMTALENIMMKSVVRENR